jgi:hypothetical protein
MPNPHQPPPPVPHKREEPRGGRVIPTDPDADVALLTPDEPRESERSVPTPTRTIRDGEIQGHPRETPGDRDSQ